MVGDKTCYTARAIGISKFAVNDIYSSLWEVQDLVQDCDIFPIGGVDDVIVVDETYLSTGEGGSQC